jgi:hypothetical protein
VNRQLGRDAELVGWFLEQGDLHREQRVKEGEGDITFPFSLSSLLKICSSWSRYGAGRLVLRTGGFTKRAASKRGGMGCNFSVLAELFVKNLLGVREVESCQDIPVP